MMMVMMLTRITMMTMEIAMLVEQALGKRVEVNVSKGHCNYSMSLFIYPYLLIDI